jgi:hypothetical protein
MLAVFRDATAKCAEVAQSIAGLEQILRGCPTRMTLEKVAADVRRLSNIPN